MESEAPCVEDSFKFTVPGLGEIKQAQCKLDDCLLNHGKGSSVSKHLTNERCDIKHGFTIKQVVYASGQC